MIATAILAVTLAGGADPYIRSRVDPAGPTDHCLYWAQNTTITWHAEQTGNPDTTGDTEFTAFEKSFATWNAQLTACASPSMCPASCVVVFCTSVATQPWL